MNVGVPELQKKEEVVPQSVVAAKEEAVGEDETALVLTTSLGHFLCHLGELIFPSVMVAMMGEFALQRNQTTALALFGYVLMGVGAMPFGIWADAWNPRKILFLYYVLLTLSGLAVAVAPDVPVLCCALTLFGLALSIYHPVGLAMISVGVRARGRILGINGVAGSLGLAFSPLLAAAALMLGSWRFAYLAFAVLSAVSATAFFFWRNGMNGPVAERGPAPTTHHRPSARSYVPLALLLVIMMLGGLNYRALVTALPPFLLGEQGNQHSRLAASTAGLLAAPGGPLLTAAALAPGRPEATQAETARSGWLAFLILLAGGIGQIFGGWLADRFGARRVYAFLLIQLLPVGLLIALFGNTPLGVLLACCLAIGLFAQQPVENVLLADYTSAARRSRSYALKFMLTFGIGAFGSVIVGQIWQETDSLNAVFCLIAALGTMMMLLLAVFRLQDAVAAGER